MMCERFGMAVRREDAVRTSFGDRLEQRRPVGVIREDEAAVVRALTPDAAHPHEPGGEGVGMRAEPPHPRRAARRQWRQYELTGK